MSKKKTIPNNERQTILKSLRAGVTPPIGLQHIQVGRVGEVKSLIENLESMKEGDSIFRLIVGDYGSGKTFFLHLARVLAWQANFATVHADLSPERRLQSSTQGYARNLYAELMKNISTSGKPNGNAMPVIVEKFLDAARKEADTHKIAVEQVIKARLTEISELRGGFDFALVIARYWTAHQKGDDELKSNVTRWLRAEYERKTDAKNDIGVSYIIEDDMFLDALKLMSLFVRQAGYKGLLVCIDEMVNIFKMNNVTARSNNYEKLLGILNASLQGNAPYLGFIFGGTPEFLEDKKKGIASYEALSSRLVENQFAKKVGIIDFSTTVLRLAPLTQEDLFILLRNVRHVYAGGDVEKYLIPDDALHAFLNHCNSVIGAAYYRTPRNTIKSFLDFLAVIDQNPEYQEKWQELLPTIEIETEHSPDFDEISEDEQEKLASVKL